MGAGTCVRDRGREKGERERERGRARDRAGWFSEPEPTSPNYSVHGVLGVSLIQSCIGENE